MSDISISESFSAMAGPDSDEESIGVVQPPPAMRAKEATATAGAKAGTGTDNDEESVAIVQPPPAKRAKAATAAARAKEATATGTAESKVYSPADIPFDVGMLVAHDIERIRTEMYVPKDGDGLNMATNCEVSMAQSIMWNGAEFELNRFNAIMLRTITRNLKGNIKNNASKMRCRIALANAFTKNSHLKLAGIHPELAEKQARNTVLRVVNVVFSAKFYDRLTQIHDSKGRPDMETKNMFAHFWTDAVEWYNKCGEENLGEDLARELTSSVHSNEPSEEVLAANLADEKLNLVSLGFCEGLKVRFEKERPNLKIAHRLTAESFRKKIYLLMKLRKNMVFNMTKSGSGSDDPEDFVQTAVAVVTNGGSLHKDAVLYFFCRSEEKKGELDAVFESDMPDTIKGSSENMGVSFQTDRARENSADKKLKRNANVAMVDVSLVMLRDHEENVAMRLDFNRANERLFALEEEKIALQKAKEEAKAAAGDRMFQLEAAKALNDTATIRKILDLANKQN